MVRPIISDVKKMLYLSISIQDIFHVSTSKLIELLVPGKHNDGDFRPTQHSKFECFLEQSILSFEESHLRLISQPIIEKYSSVAIILDWTDLDLFPAHGVCRMTILEIEIGL